MTTKLKELWTYKMARLTEGEVTIDFGNVITAEKFDDPINHGFTWMKKVDFIVEKTDRIYFIELKDPMDSKAPLKRRKEFIEKLLVGQLDSSLIYKYRDSFLYKFAENGVFNKPIYYIVLIGYERLNSAELQRRTDELKRKIPSGKALSKWKNGIVKGVVVMKFSTWRKTFKNYQLIVNRT